jgi:hypothetical protein
MVETCAKHVIWTNYNCSTEVKVGPKGIFLLVFLWWLLVWAVCVIAVQSVQFSLLLRLDRNLCMQLIDLRMEDKLSWYVIWSQFGDYLWLLKIRYLLVPVATQSKAWVCGRSPAEMWVWIPLGAWLFVCGKCCVLLGRGLRNELITRPEESYWLWCIIVCDLETSRMRRPWPALGRSTIAKQKNHPGALTRLHYQFKQ